MLEVMLTYPMRKCVIGVVCMIAYLTASAFGHDDSQLTPDELAIIESAQQRRIDAIEKVIGSVIAIYGEEKQGGGSGVIIDPSGIGLTNHHVIMGAGVQGWADLLTAKCTGGS